MRKHSKSWLKYVITALIGLLFALPAAYSRGLRPDTPLFLNARYLSDGCFVASVMLMGVGLLTWVSTTGFFDMMSYAVKSFLVLFTPLRKPENHKTFFDYKTEKDQHRGKAQIFILLVGIGFLAASLLLLAVYYHG